MKTLVKLITAFLALTVLTNTTFAFYSDVPSNHKHYEAIKELYDMGRLAEEENNLFRPDDTVKITDYYKLLIAFSGTSLSKNIDLPFTDTENFADYSKYLQTALDLGILKAQGVEPKIGIDQTITKRNALKIMFKSLGIGTSYFFDKDSFYFIDLDPYSDTAAVAQKAAELGILETKSPNLFKMAKRVTKGEVAQYLHTVLIKSTNADNLIIATAIKTENDYSAIENDLILSDDFFIFLDVWTTLQTDYIYKNDINDADLIMGAIGGMVNRVDDDYTNFQESSEASNFLESLSNEYEGVGMIIEIIDNNITIISPFKDSPAEKAGLKPNDIIVEIDGENIVGQNTNYAVSKIKGPANTIVKIGVLRNMKELTFSVTREAIQIRSTNYELLSSGSKKIAYIEILNFSDDTYEEFLEEANKAINDNVDGLIIDLRNNPGGYMGTAIRIVNLFTDEVKTAVMLEFANGNTIDYKTNGNGLLADYKTVILINEGSASASEILAIAVRDYGVATIIGTQSFGKGSVQEITQYNNGALFKYTISQWLSPNGTNINNIGLTPDSIIENTEEIDWQLDTALEEF